MITDEMQWNRLKNEFHYTITEFNNFLQTRTIEDLEDTGFLKQLIAMRYRITDAFLHIFMFVDDANALNFDKIIKDEHGKTNQ